MPRKSQTLSQSQSRRSIQPQSQRISPSQASQEYEARVNIQDQVNDLVRYFVNRAGEHVSFKRAELKKNVLPKCGQNFQEILNQAVTILKEVYGYKVIVVDPKQNSTKSYIISNALPYIPDPTETLIHDEYPEDANKILTLLILSHIYMSDNAVSDNSLYNFLNSLGIDVERKHDVFGNVMDFITGTLKNKKYINMEIDHLSKKASFSWGARAEKEISKHDVLKFVCKMYKSTMPSSWITQYKAANEQNLCDQQNANDVEQPTQNTQA